MKRLTTGNIWFSIAVAMAVMFWCPASSAQDLKFVHLTKNQGLSQSTVKAILQDQDGFMWFGTEDGLNKYDGQSFTVYKNNPDDSASISGNNVWCLHEDDKGRLWIGTRGGGLNVYDKYSDTFRRFVSEEDNANGISSNDVYAIIRNDDESLWIGTANGLNLLNTNTFEFKRYQDDVDAGTGNAIPNDNVRCLYKDKSGVLWIGTSTSGLIAFDIENHRFEQYNDLEDGTSVVKYGNRIRSIFEDSRGTFWVGNEGSLSKFDRTNGTFEYLLTEGVRKRIASIIEDSDGVVWFSSQAGLYSYHYDTDEFKLSVADEDDPFSLNEDYVRYVYEDRAATVWTGMSKAGVSAHHRGLGKFNHTKKEKNTEYTLKSNTVFAFAEDRRGYLWVGTGEGGLSAFDRKNKVAYHYPKDLNRTHESVLTIHESSDNLIWFGSWGGGFNYFNPSTEKFGEAYTIEDYDLSNNNILCFEEDSKGNLWIGTLNGLNYFDRSNNTFTVIKEGQGLPARNVYDLYLDNNLLWVATNGGGVCAYNVNTNEFTYYTKGESNSISDNSVNCIYDDGKGNLWFGTKVGLNKFNKAAQTFTRYFQKDGLQGDYIYGILGDKQGNLWMSTNNGLSKFNPDTESMDPTAFKNYFAIDGLQYDEFNQNAYYRSKSGELFFGGIKGYNHFYPENITDNPHVPPIVITSFKVYGKESSDGDSLITHRKYIELSYRKNFFSFEFAALNYMLSEKNLYSYKMEGLDENWSVPTTRAYASYTDLEGGDYVFKVRGSNNDGVWNEEGVEIFIRIIPPFYKTNLFYSVCIFLGILVIFLFIRVREANIKKEKKVLEDKVALRTQELAQKNKDITSSIEYAKRIQEAILPERQHVFESFPEAFILYLPKDIVSGDFYWFVNKGNKKIIAAVDCTGHGVPGAFMSMIGNDLLNQIVIEKGITEPDKILDELHKGVRKALKQGYQSSQTADTNDGMDVALCTIDVTTNELHFSGAYRPLYLISDGNLEKIDGDKYPIGGAHLQLDRAFTTKTRSLKKGDSFYLFSDGYVDQFGGDRGKKFMAKRFQELLLSVQNIDMQQQKDRLYDTIDQWSKNIEQVDDILVIGVKY